MKQRKTWKTIGVPLETWEKLKAIATQRSSTQWEVIEAFFQTGRPPARLKSRWSYHKQLIKKNETFF